MKKSNIGVTRCPTNLRSLIHSINAPLFGPGVKNIFVGYEGPEDPELLNLMRRTQGTWAEVRRLVHQIAQLAALPEDMHDDYIKAVKGSAEEWKRFSNRAGVPSGLWRDWTEADIPAGWFWPYIPIRLDFTSDGGICAPGQDMLLAFFEIRDRRRLKECRACQGIFWSEKMREDGGPFGCDKPCNNVLRQRVFKARKKP